MNKVIDYLGTAFRVSIAVLLFILIQMSVRIVFDAFGIDTTVYQGAYSTIYGILVIAVFIIYDKVRSYRRDKLIKAGRTDLFNYIAAAVIAFGLLGLVTVYMYLVVYLSSFYQQVAEDIAVYNEHVDRFAALPVTEVPAWDTILDFIAAVTLIPLAEELAFRGAVFGELREKMHYIPAALISSVIFGLLHGISIQVVYAIFCGVALCFVYHYSGSLRISFLVHAVFNLAGVSLFALLESGVFVSSMNTSSMRLHFSMVEVVCIVPAFASMILMYRLSKENRELKDLKETAA